MDRIFEKAVSDYARLNGCILDRDPEAMLAIAFYYCTTLSIKQRMQIRDVCMLRGHATPKRIATATLIQYKHGIIQLLQMSEGYQDYLREQTINEEIIDE